jgi:hypothetical protein
MTTETLKTLIIRDHQRIQNKDLMIIIKILPPLKQLIVCNCPKIRQTVFVEHYKKYCIAHKRIMIEMAINDSMQT